MTDLVDRARARFRSLRVVVAYVVESLVELWMEVPGERPALMATRASVRRPSSSTSTSWRCLRQRVATDT